MSERFRDLDEVRKHKLALRAERNRVQDGLRSQLQLLGEPDFRRGVIGDAFGDMLQAWKPLKRIAKFVGGSSGVTRVALGTVLGAKAKTPMGRAAVAVASMLLPALVERWNKDPGSLGSKLTDELGVSWERVKEYVNERRKAHEERTRHE
ncbi:MAG: hypothetical protein JNM62_14405 [Flavobacteriales bacterium]|nr:hypothetical protein [Flavobacteriales bacterium]